MFSNREDLLEDRLTDIVEHISIANEIIAHQSFGEFVENPIDLLAAQKCLEIISEASIHIADSIGKEGFEEIFPNQDLESIRAFGNKSRHEYYKIDSEVMWNLIENQLPEMREDAERMIKRILELAKNRDFDDDRER